MSALVRDFAVGLVVLAGLYFVILAVAAFARPALARRFILGFAQSAGAHYAEMAARIIVGAALVIASPRMLFSQIFSWFGVALLASSILLLCLPWTWHRAMGERVLPRFVRYLGVVASISLLLGGVLIAATIAGAA